MKRSQILAMLFLLPFIGCNNNTRTEKGFIVFDDPSFWYFVPTKDFSTEACAGSFATSNFKLGTQFHPRFNGSSLVKEALDTLRIDSVSDGANSTLKLLKIAPVELEYEIESKSVEKSPKYMFTRNIEGKKVQFGFTALPIQIRKATPLYCYARKKSDVKTCNCEKRDDDQNDYLLKVCKYLKSKGDVSYQPCKYKINEINESMLEGKKVVAVHLNCCYLGDVAYFDSQSKELISFSFGPE